MFLISMGGKFFFTHDFSCKNCNLFTLCRYPLIGLYFPWYLHFMYQRLAVRKDEFQLSSSSIIFTGGNGHKLEYRRFDLNPRSTSVLCRCQSRCPGAEGSLPGRSPRASRVWAGHLLWSRGWADGPRFTFHLSHPVIMLFHSFLTLYRCRTISAFDQLKRHKSLAPFPYSLLS